MPERKTELIATRLPLIGNNYDASRFIRRTKRKIEVKQHQNKSIGEAAGQTNTKLPSSRKEEQIMATMDPRMTLMNTMRPFLSQKPNKKLLYSQKKEEPEKSDRDVASINRFIKVLKNRIQRVSDISPTKVGNSEVFYKSKPKVFHLDVSQEKLLNRPLLKNKYINSSSRAAIGYLPSIAKTNRSIAVNYSNSKLHGLGLSKFNTVSTPTIATKHNDVPKESSLFGNNDEDLKGILDIKLHLPKLKKKYALPLSPSEMRIKYLTRQLLPGNEKSVEVNGIEHEIIKDYMNLYK